MASGNNREPGPSWFTQQPTLTIFFLLTIAYIGSSLVNSIYSVYFGPLSRYHGPKIRAWSVIPKAWSIFSGNEGTDYPKLHARFGPVVRIAPNELSFVGNAQTLKDIYGFKKMGEKSLAKDSRVSGKPLNGVDNLLTADDANHTRQRKILSYAFADRSLKDLEPMLKSWVSFLMKKLNECAAAGEKADMLKYYNCTTFDIMADLCFNESLHMLENTEYSDWVHDIFEGLRQFTPIRAITYLGKPFEYFVNEILFQHKKVREKAYQHWAYCAERVDRRLARTPERADLWSKIIDKSTGPEALTLDEHYATAVVFMGAGTETSATALSGITYHLLQNPDTLARLTQDIRAAFSDLDDVTLDGLRRLDYLHAVINEGMRMQPPVPIALARKVPKGGSIIGGEWVPEDTIVGIHQLSTYRSEANFKNADEFHPERWLGDPEYENDHLAAWEPFSVGPRNCLGKNLAWHEIRLILATTLLYFDLSLCEESNNWTDQKVYLLWEKKPLMCALTPAKA